MLYHKAETIIINNINKINYICIYIYIYIYIYIIIIILFIHYILFYTHTLDFNETLLNAGAQRLLGKPSLD